MWGKDLNTESFFRKPICPHPGAAVLLLVLLRRMAKNKSHEGIATKKPETLLWSFLVFSMETLELSSSYNKSKTSSLEFLCAGLVIKGFSFCAWGSRWGGKWRSWTKSPRWEVTYYCREWCITGKPIPVSSTHWRCCNVTAKCLFGLTTCYKILYMVIVYCTSHWGSRKAIPASEGRTLPLGRMACLCERISALIGWISGEELVTLFIGTFICVLMGLALVQASFSVLWRYWSFFTSLHQKWCLRDVAHIWQVQLIWSGSLVCPFLPCGVAFHLQPRGFQRLHTNTCLFYVSELLGKRRK